MTDAPARAELPEASAETPKDIGELTSAVDANLCTTDVATAPMQTVWVDPLAGRQ